MEPQATLGVLRRHPCSMLQAFDLYENQALARSHQLSPIKLLETQLHNGQAPIIRPRFSGWCNQPDEEAHAHSEPVLTLSSCQIDNQVGDTHETHTSPKVLQIFS